MSVSLEQSRQFAKDYVSSQKEAGIPETEIAAALTGAGFNPNEFMDAQIGEGAVFEGISQERAFSGIATERVEIDRSKANDTLLIADKARKMGLTKTGFDPNLSEQENLYLDQLMGGEGGDSLSLKDMFSFEEGTFKPDLLYRSPGAEQESVNVVAATLGLPEKDARVLVENDPEHLEKARAAAASQRKVRDTQELEAAISEASTPEEVTQALHQASQSSTLPPTTLEEYVITVLENKEKDKVGLDKALRSSAHNLFIKGEVDKALAGIWKDTKYSDLGLDFGQALIPGYGWAEEELTKWAFDFDNTVRELKESNPREAKELITKLVDAMQETGSYLAGNHNALYSMLILSHISDEFKEAGYAWVDGVHSDAEFQMKGQTVLFGAIEASGIGTLTDLYKLIVKRILPAKRNSSIEASVLKYDEDLLENIELDPSLYPFREMNRTIDTLSEIDINSVKRSMFESDLGYTLRQAGLSPQEGSERLLPSMGNNLSPGLPNPDLSQKEISELLLINVKPSESAEARAHQLAKELGKNAVVQTSDIRILNNTDDLSIGDFVIDITGTEGKFATRDEALAVQSQLFGRDSKVVEVGEGEFVVRVKEHHRFNPELDIGQPLEKAKSILSDDKILPHMLSPIHTLGKEYVEAASVFTDVARAKMVELSNRFNKAVTTWKASKVQDLSNLLAEAAKRGEADGTALKRSDLDNIVRNNTSKKDLDELWERFTEVREITDEIFRATDHRFRLNLDSQGYKFVKIGDDVNYGKKVSASEIEDSSNFRLLDLETNSLVKLSDVKDSDKVLVRLTDNVKDGEGNAYKYVVSSPSRFKPLPAGPLLNKRVGYVPRYYSQTGYTVTQKVARTVNGVTKDVDEITHIVKSKKQARKVVANAIQNGVNPKNIRFNRSRENSSIELRYGNSNEVSYGFGSLHSRSRGKHLSGAEGAPAPTVNPLTAIATRINRIENEYKHAAIASLQSKFRKMFSDVLKPGARWSDDVGNMLDPLKLESNRSKAEISTIRSRAANFHHYVNTLRGVRNADVVSRLDSAFQKMFNEAFESREPVTATVRFLKQMATMGYIIGRPFFQATTNIAQNWAIFAKYPVATSWSAARGIAMTPFVLAAKATGNVPPQLWAAFFGTSNVKMAGEIADFLFNKSGLVRGAGLADDIVGPAMDDLSRTFSGPTGHYLSKAWSGTGGAAYAGLKGVQTGTIQFGNITAFMAEVSHQMMTKGSKFKWDAETKADVLFRSRQLTMTQNRTNPFKYQNQEGITGMMLQFMQYVQQMFISIVSEPMAKVAHDIVLRPAGKVVGKDLKYKPAGIYAEDLPSAVRISMMNLALFGTSGFIGETGSRDLSNEIRERWPQIDTDPKFKAVHTAITGGLVNDLLPGTTSRVTPAAVLDSIAMVVSSDINAWQAMSGAAGSYGLGMLDIGASVYHLQRSNVLDTEEKFYASLKEVAWLAASLKDTERAYVAYNFMQAPYSANLAGSIAVSTREAIAMAFSITPDMMLDYYNERSKGSSGFKRMNPFSDNAINKVFLKAANRKLTELKASGKYDYKTFVETVTHYSRAAKDAHGNDNIDTDVVDKYFWDNALSPHSTFFSEFAAPYINKLDYKETRENLRRLQRDTDDEQFKNYLEYMLWTYSRGEED